MTVARPHRGTIFEERAEVLAHERFAGDQFVLTLQAPKCARAATPGSFVHLSCDEQVPMRRPLSIMRAHPERGSIEVLYKIVGPGLRLAGGTPRRRIDQRARPDRQRLRRRIRERPRTLLVGGGVGIPPMVFLAETLRERHGRAVEAAGADGLGDPVSVPRAALDDPRAGHARRRHRLHAAARRMGHPQPPRQPRGLSRAATKAT